MSTRLSAEELHLGPMESAAFDGRTTSASLRSMVGVLVAEARSLVAERDNARAESVRLRDELAIQVERGDAWRALVKEDTVTIERLREALRDFCDWADEDEPDGTAVEILHFHEAFTARFAERARALLESETPQ